MAGRELDAEEKKDREPYSAKRFHDDPGFLFSVCSSCAHWRGVYGEHPEKKGRFIVACDAFPAGIPEGMDSLFKDERDLDAECNSGIKFEWDGFSKMG